MHTFQPFLSIVSTSITQTASNLIKDLDNDDDLYEEVYYLLGETQVSLACYSTCGEEATEILVFLLFFLFFFFFV